MNEVLPLLRRDSLIKFEYFTGSKFCFPTPRQLDSLYSRQKRLQGLQLHSHMVPWFAELEREHNQNVLLKSLTEGDIGDRVNSSAITPDQLYWLFRNVNFCLLKRLSLNGQDSRFRREFLVIIDLFSGQSFVRNITFGKTVRFTNMPSLRSLVVEYCKTIMRNRLRLPLEFPEDCHLESLEFWTMERAEPLSHLLTQFSKLKRLVIRIRPSSFLSDYQAGTDFIRAVVLRGDALRLFEIIGRNQGFPKLSQLFPRVHLENIPNFYYGVWSVFPQSHTIIRLSAN